LNPLTEFVVLRSKMYAFKSSNSNDNSKKTVKKWKGVKRSAIDQLTFNSFEKCLFSEEEVVGSMSMIRSKNHLLSTVKCKKLVFSHKDKGSYTKQ